MKRVLCAVAAALVLLGSAAAYNGYTTVYITRTGECYHREHCSYLKSCIEISLEDAVNRGYRPCSRCRPPTLDGPAPSAEQALTESGRRYVGQMQDERDKALQEKKDAEELISAMQKELIFIKRSISAAGLIGIPLYLIWFASWRKRAYERMREEVRASMVGSPSHWTERLESHKGRLNRNPQQAIPAPKAKPKPEPKAEQTSRPERLYGQSRQYIPYKPKPREKPVEEFEQESEPKQEPDPPVKPPYGPEESENPSPRETYRQLYEGKSIAVEAGVPPGCGIWFDAETYPHQMYRGKDVFAVYITKQGKSYHTSKCPSAKRGKAVNLCYAKQIGLCACERCNPMKIPEWVTEYQRIFRICKALGIDVKP